MRHPFRQRSLHCGFTLFFQFLYFGCGEQEVLRHVSTTAECWLELFQHQKNLTVVIAWFILWLDVNWADFTTVLTCIKVRTCAIVRVIKAKARRLWREYDAPCAMGCNVRCSFLRRSINICRNHLTMPMKLFRNICFVVNVYSNLLAFFKTKQWARELPAIGGEGNDAVLSNFDGCSCYSDSV